MSRMTPLSRWNLSTAVLAIVIFGCTGRVYLPMMWAYLAVYWGLGLLTALIANPSLDAERRQPGPGAIDPISRPAASLLFLATVAIAALDAGRFHWTTTVPWAARFTSLVVFMLASALQNWAISANPFFSTAIRIQSERGHRVITSGPYHLIRHPGYLAMAIAMPATALVLGSFVALIPAFFYSFLILWRSRREDRLLTEDLGAYSEYAGVVRYRLIPRLW